MKATMLALAAALVLPGSGAARAHPGLHVHYTCDAADKNTCPPPPAPPAPPAPPSPPSALAPAAPMALGAIPVPPAPPAPPPIPAVPAQAHAACAARAAGARLSYEVSAGATMTGVCGRENGKAVFRLREYRVDQ